MQSVIPVFIASPNDVSKERKYAVEAVRNVSSRLASVFGVVLTPITWEEFAPVSSGESLNPQFNILKKIKSRSIFIGLLYKRYGTIIPEMGDISGTESEFNHALNHRKNVQILTYFRDTKNLSGLGTNEAYQLASLNKLKDKLYAKNIFPITYSNEQDFRRRIVLDLFEAACEAALNIEEMKQQFNEHSKVAASMKKRIDEARSTLVARIPKVFISYAHEDEVEARKIYRQLGEFGFHCWLDKEALLPGNNWDREIRRAISNTDFIIILVSRKVHAKRGYIQREIRMALDIAQEIPADQAYLIPVRIEDCEIPEDIARYQCCDLFRDEGATRLVEAMLTHWNLQSQR